VKPSEQLRWEAEYGPKAAVAAFAAGLFTLISLVIQIGFVGGGGGNEKAGLLRIHEHQGALLASLVAQAISVFLVIAALVYLTKATMARRPEQLRFLWPLLAAAPVLLAVGAVLTQLNLGDLANKFVNEGVQTNARAKNIVDDRDTGAGIIASAGTLFLALSYVLVSVNAMRSGLLSRFMGILGIVAGALLVLPILPGGGSFVQLFWIIALGVLFLNRWPNGRGPAWSVVEVIPWPTQAQTRALAAEGPGEPAVADASAPAAEEKQGPSRSSRKKRKKRR
jgi:hypothetical protein